MIDYILYARDAIEQIEIYRRLKTKSLEGFKWVIINTYTKKTRGYFKTKLTAKNFISLNEGEESQLIIVEVKNIVVKLNNL